MNKSEFIAAMESQLLRLSKTDRDDILNDYESHFVNGVAEGKTEEEVSAQLGDPVELAAVYLENLPEGSKGAPYIPEPEPVPEPQPEPYAAYKECDNNYSDYAIPSEPEPQPYGNQTYNAPKNTAAEPSSTGIVAVVLLSIFVALPLLWFIVGLILGAFGTAIGCVAACATLITLGVTTAAWGAMTATGFILIGISLIAMCVLSICLGIIGIKGTIQLTKWYIEQCKKMIGGNI